MGSQFASKRSSADEPKIKKIEFNPSLLKKRHEGCSIKVELSSIEMQS